MNTGIIKSLPSNKAYISGIVSGVVYEVRLENGDWRLHMSTGEKQNSVYFDALACVSFSFNNSVEPQINWLKPLLTDKFLLTLLTPSELILFKEFFNDAGEADLSDRALAKLSGTSKKGNTFENVASIGRIKCLPERVWGYPREQRTPVFDWDDFYAPIPDELIKKYSDVFFKVFKIETEFIATSEIEKHLKQAPVQVAVGFCPGWNTNDPVKACSLHSQHGVVRTAPDPHVQPIGDSYPPYAKNLAKDYTMDSALKIIVSINKKQTMIIKENYLYQLVEAPGGFALGLNGNLVIDDLAKVLASWLMRGGDFSKRSTITLADWNSVPHINLKGEILN